VNLKYAKELQGCREQPCPGKKYAKRTMTAYRWMHNKAIENDFEPLPEHKESGKCAGFAISFWETLEIAQEKYKSIASFNDDGGATARDKYGDHIGEIDLCEDDGLVTLPNGNGHISLHCAKDAKFTGRVNAYTRCTYLEQFAGKKRNA
jgi:hypothetical protein